MIWFNTKADRDGLMNKWLKRMSGIGLFAFIAMQFGNPSHQNPPVLPGNDVLASNPPPPSVTALLMVACYDCHSFETKWPWYSYVAPVSWSVVRDVNAARASLNFSDWPHGEARRERKRWRRVAEVIQNGEMPLPSYTWIHRQARLDTRQRAELVKWAEGQAEK
jgi:hypothetical protein